MPDPIIDPRDGKVCCSDPFSCSGTAGPRTEGCLIPPGYLEAAHTDAHATGGNIPARVTPPGGRGE